jgi:hypothetical protein
MNFSIPATLGVGGCGCGCGWGVGSKEGRAEGGGGQTSDVESRTLPAEAWIPSLWSSASALAEEGGKVRLKVDVWEPFDKSRPLPMVLVEDVDRLYDSNPGGGPAAGDRSEIPFVPALGDEGSGGEVRPEWVFEEPDEISDDESDDRGECEG